MWRILDFLLYKVESTCGSICLKHDSDLDPNQIDKICSFLSQTFCTSCTQKVAAQRTIIQTTRKMCSGVIKCKPIKGAEMRTQVDGYSERADV